MKNIFQIIILFLTTTILFGQNKYVYEYEASLKPGLSNFNIQIKDLQNRSDSTLVSFKIADKQGNTIPGVSINIESILSKKIVTNFDGLASINLPNKSYSFIVYSMGFTEMKIPNIELNGNSEVNINITLGYQNQLRTAIIRSKQKLTQSEIEKIIEDLSNENEENNILIKNKICIISWQI